MSSTPDEFLEWFFATHGSECNLELEMDVDECCEDRTFDDIDLY